MSMPVKLSRDRITNPLALDITVKSSTGWKRLFAPTWPMVNGHKAGTLSDEAYTEQYHKILESLPVSAWRALYEHGRANGGVVVVSCYCNAGRFCHTHVLINWMIARYPRAFVDGREPVVMSQGLLDLGDVEVVGVRNAFD